MIQKRNAAVTRPLQANQLQGKKIGAAAAPGGSVPCIDKRDALSSEAQAEFTSAEHSASWGGAQDTTRHPAYIRQPRQESRNAAGNPPEDFGPRGLQHYGKYLCACGCRGTSDGCGEKLALLTGY